MVRFILLTLSCLLALPLAAQDISREEMLDLLRENHHRAAAGHNSYEAPEFADTRAPRGFRPVYVSHYGRHGSRYQGSRSFFEQVLSALDALSSGGGLTTVGDSLRQELHIMCEAHDDMEYLLTGKGSREQSEIAERLCRRVPSLFRQKEALSVSATSTSAVRCLQSMAYFVTALKGFSPDLEVSYGTGLAKHLNYLAPRWTPEDRSFVKSHYLPLQDSLLAVTPAVSSAAGRFFTDVSKAVEVSGCGLESFIYDIFEAAQGAGCLDVKVDPLRFFTTEELYDFLEIRNLYFCANYGPLAPTKAVREKVAATLLRGIVKDADAALAGNARCADFRFGHDGGFGPLMMLAGIEGFDKEVDPGMSLLQWPAWKYIPMCSNLQMIFYRNRKGEVLVKFLRNETEAEIPALKAQNRVYYRWQDVRRYFLVRTGDYKELPDYYADYLDAKVSEINALKRDEADGFFFWTDSHFPDNAGNAAGVLEYLQGKIGPHKLFYGGDVAKNADKLEGGVSANTSSLLQAGLYGMLCPIRGNHDFTSTTRDVPLPETMGNVEVNRYLSSFLLPSAVTDPDACCPNYYYVDAPEGKIRYIVFDSTDSVSDRKIRYGMSDRQIEWIRSEAMGTLPRGWSLVCLSHVPLSPDHSVQASLLAAGDAVAGRSDVLLCMCGHRHSDMESGIGTVFQVLTAADCLEDVGRTITPYSLRLNRKAAGTVEEQTIDYVSVSKDHKTVTMKRIGWGHDRIFNVKPVTAKVGDVLEMKPSLPGDVAWFVFDACGNQVGKYNDEGFRKYVTSHDNAVVSEQGRLQCLVAGESIAVALHTDGTKEYFMVSISE